MTALQFLEIRFSALAAGDYTAVYESYHDDAPFMQQFSDCRAYLHFAQQQLPTIAIKDWHCLQQRTLDAKEVEVLLVMEIAVDGGCQFFYELALLIETAQGWRYHSAQKLGADDYQGSPELIDFCHFDNATPKIRF